MRTTNVRSRMSLACSLFLLFGLWTLSRQDAMAASTCIVDDYCDLTGGENCDNCEDDCDCECGNDVCEGPESCAGCPEDCYEACVCGDTVCDWPAESGGYPFESCEEAEWYFPNVECHYCESDCYPCDNGLCAWLEFMACSDETGWCAPCVNWPENNCAQGYSCVDGWCIEIGKD